MAGHEAGEQTLTPSRCKPKSNTKRRTLTITNIKVLECQLWAWIVKKDFAIQREQHGVLCHIYHAPHNVARLPRAPVVFVTLVPPLSLGTEESPVTGKARRTGPTHPPLLAWLPAAPSMNTAGGGAQVNASTGVAWCPSWPVVAWEFRMPPTNIVCYWILRKDPKPISLFWETVNLKI